MPPLGYDVKDRKLVINDAEAPIVVEIYRRYLALKSVRALKEELAGAGIRSKRRVRPDGTVYGSQQIARGALYLMLQNRIYRGEITHRGNSYPGEHAIDGFLGGLRLDHHRYAMAVILPADLRNGEASCRAVDQL